MAAEEASVADEKDLLTLTQVAEKAGISMPTAAKYKKQHQNRIPTVGKGRTQRFPEEAVAVFKEIYEENVSSRGGAAKSASKAKGSGGRKRKGKRKAKGKGRRKRAKSSAKSDLMPLTKVAKAAGVSYPTAQNYVKKHLDRIPHEGKGRSRRYPEEAVAAVKAIYEENAAKYGGGGAKKTAKPKRSSSRSSGRKRTATAGASDPKLASVLDRLEKRLASLEKLMSKPLKVEIKR